MYSFKYLVYKVITGKFPTFAEKFYYGQYFHLIDNAKKESLNSENTKSRQIWTMWLQEKIPEICSMCIDSIKSFYPNTIILTEKNINEYITIPDYIMNKYKSGKMRACFLSDYIRVCLLDKFGGVWIDSTCYLTQKIPEYIFKSDFFMLKNFACNLKNFTNNIKNFGFSNYFIYSDKNNFFVKLLKSFLEEYWKKEDKEIYYHFFHRFIKNAVLYNDYTRKQWDNIPIGLNFNTKLMYEILFKNFDEDIYKWLCETSFLHKLTYKELEKDKNPNSLYRYLISNYRNKKAPV